MLKRTRVKMISMIALVVLVSTGLFFLISYHRARESMSAQLESNYSALADRYAQELTAWVDANAAIIDVMSAEITTGGIYEEDYETFHRYLAENHSLLNSNGNIFDIYFTYPDNRMVCASDFTADGTVDYVHDRDWFTVAAGTGEVFYSTPYLDSDSGKPIITISRGIYRDNTLQGVFAADIFVDVLVDIIDSAEVAPDSYAFLVDQNLGMIVHPNPAYAFDDVPHGVMEIPGAPYEEVISKIRSNSEETVYLRDYDGVFRGIVVSRMDNTGWHVGIATSRAELTKSFASLTRGFLIAALAAIIIGGIIAIFLGRVLDMMNRQQEQYAEQVRKLEKQVEHEKKAQSRFLSELGSEEEQPADENAEEPAASGRSRLLIPMLIIFLLMVCMVVYTSRIIRNVAVLNIQEVGEDRISVAAAELENYLETEKSTLWVTADTVNHMVQAGSSTRDILEYLMEETQNQKENFNVNITGFYGYVMGEYLDGLAWEPPDNYDPTRRDWYLEAIRARGRTVIVSPYVDAQTDAVVISIVRMLSSGTDVVAVDVLMDHIQEIASQLQIKEKGYGFIVNRDGLVIAHRDEEKTGGYLTEDEDQLALIDRIREVKNGSFEITLDNKKSTVFVQEIADEWFAVIVISNRELFAEVYQQLLVNVLICTVIFVLITFFYLLGNRNEKNYLRRLNEMRVERQKQSYEAKVLKLEKEASDQSNQAKSDFLANVSHEIRTPINAVLGMNEMILREIGRIREQPDPKRQREIFDRIRTYAGNIESAGNSLLSIINDLLDFSKIEAGKMEIIEVEYRLSSLLIDVSNMILLRAQGKGLEYCVDVDGTIPDILSGDEQRVRQIIVNLLNNAVKYTDRGSVRLEVHAADAERREGEVLTLVFSVEDTGIGIREEDIRKLFGKFQRVDLKRNGTVEGTGLGLAITRKLIAMMHGDIAVESTYGKGSTFTVHIPQRIVSHEAIGDFQTRLQSNRTDTEAYRETLHAPDAHILIVDDTRMNLMVAVGLLDGSEIRIDTASSGTEAVEAARSVPYDLILMDQRMPVMDGTEALRLIRGQQDGANRTTPVICLTADAIKGARERYIADGFTDYLTKPIDSAELEKLLRKYLPEEKLLSEDTEIASATDTEGASEATSDMPPEIAGETVSDTALEAAGATASEAAQDETADGGDIFNALRKAGVQKDIGLRYCGNDEGLYLIVLREFLASADDRMRDLRTYFDEANWKDYGILVHSLKSASLIIGAEELSGMAAALQGASDRRDEEVLRQNHGEMMERYRRITELLAAYLSAAEKGDAL